LIGLQIQLGQNVCMLYAQLICKKSFSMLVINTYIVSHKDLWSFNIFVQKCYRLLPSISCLFWSI